MPLLGRFDEAFLDVPPEVIQLTARVNQKYFVCRGKDGALANAFICTANIVAADGGAKIVEGNRKVLAARLSDARFFYETDLKVALADQAKKLEKIVFHEKLGTLADKVDRVAKLARWLAETGMVRGADPVMAERAARLAKADLVTGMVGEFPELQGLMGGYYARAQGEAIDVTAAIRDHYKPVGQGDVVPTAPVTVAVALADKLDTLSLFFLVGLPPSGSKDPFALRRAALGVLELITINGIRGGRFGCGQSCRSYLCRHHRSADAADGGKCGRCAIELCRGHRSCKPPSDDHSILSRQDRSAFASALVDCVRRQAAVSRVDRIRNAGTRYPSCSDCCRSRCNARGFA